MPPTSLATSLLHVTLLLLGIVLLPLANAAAKANPPSYAETCTRLQSALSFQSKVHHPRKPAIIPPPPHSYGPN